MPPQPVVLSYVDILAVLLLLFGFIRGLFRGMSGETSGFSCGTIAVIAAALAFSPILNIISGGSGASGWKYLAFGLSLIAGFVGLMATRYLFDFLQQAPVKSIRDRIGGAIAGILHLLTIVLFLFVALTLAPLPQLQRVCGQESKFGRKIVAIEQGIQRTIVEDIIGVQDEIMLKREEKTNKRVPK